MSLEYESNILIINDTPDQLEVMTLLLSQAGYRIHTARDGCEGFEIARRERPDLVISDVMMPCINGIELCRKIRAAAEISATSILLVSAMRRDTDSVVEGLQAGADDYLEAPYDPVRLIAKVARLLERKQALSALRESEARYRLMFASSPLPMWVYDLETLAFLDVNEAAVQHYGYSREEFLGMTIKEIRPPEDIPALINAVAKAAPGLTHSGTWRHRKNDGTIIEVEISSHLLLFDGRRAELVLANDITKRRRAEESLQRRDAILKAVSFAAGQFLETISWEQSVDQVLERLGQATEVCRVYIFENHTSVEGELLVSQRYEWVKPGIAPQINNPELQELRFEVGGFAPWAETLSQGRIIQGHVRQLPADVRAHLAGQDILSIIIVPIFVAEKQWGFIGFDECLTEREWSVVETDALKTASGILGAAIQHQQVEGERTRLQDFIQKSAAEWRLTFDAIEHPMLILDSASRVVKLNRAAKELIGSANGRPVGQDINAIGDGQPWRKAAELADLVRWSDPAKSRQILDESNGKTWDLTANLIPGPGVGEGRIVLVARDITQTVEMQTSLRRNETMSMMGALVAGVAHEVRNPLFAITSTLDAFEARFGGHEEYQKYMDIFRGELERLNGLMQELLEYGKPSTAQFYQGPIEDIIAQAVRTCNSLAELFRVKIVNNIDRKFAPVRMDRRRMIQVFLNLLENSIHHSPPDGTITVSAEEIYQDDQAWIDCAVRDHGPGFRAEDLPRIFEPFFTRRRKGSGLGLSIVQRIVEEHDGQIIAGNHPEGGALMRVRFPLTAADQG